MKQMPFRVTYFSLDDTWCRYFTLRRDAEAFMRQKSELGYRVELTAVSEI